MTEQSSRHLERIANLTSLAVAAFFALTVPAGYFLISYNNTSQLLHEQANVVADTVSEIIYEHPDFWVYQEQRLIDMITVSNWRRTPRSYIISDANNDTVVEVGNKIPFPSLSIVANLSDGEKQVGLLQVSTSLKPMLKTTLVVSIIGVLLAWLIHYLLKVLPFAALKRSLQTLTHSQQTLQREVQAKQTALQNSHALSEKMRHQALHDALTGLPNRAYFNEYSNTKIHNAGQDIHFALLMLDLNHFKEINDSLGHHAGDALLKEVSLRLQQITDDETFLARLGGDEFAIFATVDHCANALDICDNINIKFNQHIELDGYHISVSGSIGLACYPQHGKTMSEIMRRADMAMYQAKAAGDLYRIYETSFDDNSPNRLTLTADLRHALDHNELHLVYQPKIFLHTHKLAGVETFLVWEHKEHGNISPELFISLAEASGMINDLSRMVVRQSLQQLLTWKRQELDINIAINLSARNLQDESLVPFIKQLTSDYTIDPGQLTFEITESNIMSDPDKAQKQIASLSQWGAKISIDDYGTGYSSLAYLSRLAVDELKIDKSFILNILNSSDDRVIVRSTIEMAHNLGITVIAEGIENQETVDLLIEYGCELGQGYYYCRPTEADNLLDFLSQYR